MPKFGAGFALHFGSTSRYRRISTTSSHLLPHDKKFRRPGTKTRSAGPSYLGNGEMVSQVRLSSARRPPARPSKSPVSGQRPTPPKNVAACCFPVREDASDGGAAGSRCCYRN
ncbi:Hypothetical protein NTJ_13781 [Nesidiocoris tenuis]|uniref:Uncharacterized protein n=1 Tax=Nesidiocoris tenuis TaxID=355587 RepID=A0ABN7BBE8_9HEMI|nr:Hypothetical protein NTJ_13781 [Nesidiocoris tenuis]